MEEELEIPFKTRCSPWLGKDLKVNRQITLCVNQFSSGGKTESA